MFINNNRGVSLLEILVAVSIIGIISAIAVPAFNDYRSNAARVASDTSVGNVAKAFRNCIVLKAVAQCSTFANLSMQCPAGSTCTTPTVTGGRFCAHIKRGTVGQNDFNACVSVNTSDGGDEFRSYGGALLEQNKTVCHRTETDAGSCTAKNSGNEYIVSGLKDCTVANLSTDCGPNVPANAGTNTCGVTYACKSVTTTGECDTTTGNCK